MRRFVPLALAILAADIASKILVTRSLVEGHPVEVLGSVLRWVYVKNHGSAFSLLQSGRVFFIVFSALSILLILALARHPRYRTRPFLLAFSMILGGAFGNLIDRIVRGYVVDFIDVGIGGNRWPTFNVADIGVTVGVALLAILLLREPREHAETSAREADGTGGEPIPRDPLIEESRKEGS